MAKKAQEKEITLKPIAINTAEITIVGDSDLVLNKMNDVNARLLIGIRKDEAKDMEKSNVWEEIITAMHWRDGKPTDFSEEGLERALRENAPCLTTFGLKKSFGDAVVRNKLDTYATAFHANTEIVGALVPITFAGHYIDEKLMSPRKGKPILVHLNRFTGWEAKFTIRFTDMAYGINQIANIIELAGFGLGIGSGRSSGYGRYHIKDIQ